MRNGLNSAEVFATLSSVVATPANNPYHTLLSKQDLLKNEINC